MRLGLTERGERKSVGRISSRGHEVAEGSHRDCRVGPLGLLAMTVLFFYAAASARGASLSEVPPLPPGTPLFKSEETFARRGKPGGFAMKPSKYAVYYDSHVHREGSKESLRLRYRKAPDPSFCGAYIILVGNLGSYSTISFWVKGMKGAETFEIGVNDTISNKREDAVFAGSIHRYLPGGVTTDWQQVEIPLAHFFGADLTRVYSLVFNFNEDGEGIFWVDDLKFNERPVGLWASPEASGNLLLDNFDHSNLNLLGRKANAYKRLPSVCAFSRTTEERLGSSGRSLRLDFEKQSTGWCGYYTLLNEIDGDYFDLSPYKAVSFWVKGAQGGEIFEIGMADKSWLTIGDSVKAGAIDKYLPAGITTQWQQVMIPLSDFGKLDWTHIGSFVINFHRPSRGAVFVEDLTFVRKTGEELLKEWEE